MICNQGVTGSNPVAGTNIINSLQAEATRRQAKTLHIGCRFDLLGVSLLRILILMSLGKQAKILTKPQIDALLAYVSTRRHPIRNRVILLLSFRAGLRAKEIAGLTWKMILNADGTLADEIALEDSASKNKSGRRIPMAKDLKQALSELRECNSLSPPEGRVIRTERADQTSAQVIINLFAAWYRALGFMGCSSHSGRRTFITNAARRISVVGGSLRDVQVLAGHLSLSTTQRYIEYSPLAARKVVDLV